MTRRANAAGLIGAAGASWLAMVPVIACGQAAPASGAAATTITDATTPDDPDDDDQAPADIVITAGKRDKGLQEATLSVTAITADELRRQNITDITGLNGQVPGLVVARSGGAERIITIRGIGSETPENTNTQPGVSYHVDGVYIFNTIAANAAFIDVAQVEVLRGPQGTTFGQGSTGGTINVVSNQPDLDAFGGTLNAGVGNYALMRGDGALNIPLGRFAIRGAAQFTRHDGYARATGVPVPHRSRPRDAWPDGPRRAGVRRRRASLPRRAGGVAGGGDFRRPAAARPRPAPVPRARSRSARPDPGATNCAA